MDMEPWLLCISSPKANNHLLVDETLSKVDNSNCFLMSNVAKRTGVLFFANYIIVDKDVNMENFAILCFVKFELLCKS